MELWFTERHTPYVNFSIKVERQLYTAQSEFQRIDVFESREFGRFLTLDGYMMLTEKDEFIYHEMITHIPMAVHPNPENILVIGAGDGGVGRSASTSSRSMSWSSRSAVSICRRRPAASTTRACISILQTD